MADGRIEFFDTNTGVLYHAGYEFYKDPDTVVIEWARTAMDGKRVRLSKELCHRMEVVAMQDHYAYVRRQLERCRAEAALDRITVIH